MRILRACLHDVAAVAPEGLCAGLPIDEHLAARGRERSKQAWEEATAADPERQAGTCGFSMIGPQPRSSESMASGRQQGSFGTIHCGTVPRPPRPPGSHPWAAVLQAHSAGCSCRFLRGVSMWNRMGRMG